MPKHRLKSALYRDVKPFVPEGLFAAAIALTGYAFAFSGGSLVALVTAQLVLIALSFFLMLTTRRSTLNFRNILIWSGFSSILLVTVLVNVSNYDTLGTPGLEYAFGHVLGLIGVIFALQWATRNLRILNVLTILSFLLLPLIASAIVTSALSFGLLSRSTPFGIHPNWWGELGFAFILASLALRKRTTAVLFIVIAFLLFFLVQSRGAALASIASIGCYGFLNAQISLSLRRIVPVISLFGAGFLFTLFVFRDTYQSLTDFLSNRVLFLNDPYRGLDTGLTGRLESWEYAVEVFANNIVFGNGMDTLGEVHNGFLQVAAEGGLALLLPLILWMLVAMVRAWKQQDYLALSILVGYIVYAMTYPRMLNMNLAAILFFMSLFPWGAARVWLRKSQPRNPAHKISSGSAQFNRHAEDSRSRHASMYMRRKTKRG